ncbi:hypothetical protein SOVF_064540 [Spinacia oleracea]|nr:hypothetical protein SOVF_064540 [Spinacia oleracea]
MNRYNLTDRIQNLFLHRKEKSSTPTTPTLQKPRKRDIAAARSSDDG